jgi:predicted DNA-binding ArsR family transcriptional regulator
MLRTKVVNDSTDLIPLIRAFDNPVKKAVFKEIQADWKPLSEITKKYGDDGQIALELFDQMKLVETKWTTPDEGIDGRPQKKYRSYYSAFNINISCPVNEISEIFTIASLQKKDFCDLEKQIVEFIGEEGKFSNTVAENFNMTPLALKSIVKRSEKLAFKGLKIIRK